MRGPDSNRAQGRSGDYNNDGVVDGIDYLTWAGNFGQGPNEGVAVPEPGALAMLLTAMLGLVLTRRWR